MSATPLVSVVLLSYNRPHMIERALKSVLRQTHSNLEVLVVDNRSTSSHDIAAIVGRYPRVRLVANSHNDGFAGGMNRGLQCARGDYVYLTEDDIEVEPDSIRALVDYLEEHADVGLAGPVMINRQSQTIRCAGGNFSLGSVYRMTILGAGEQPGRRVNVAPYRVRYLPGATLMASRSLFRRLGGFREEFFMYVEDVEFCARVLESRLSIAVVPAARVVHDEPEARDGTSPVIEFHKIKNLASLYLIHAPLAVIPVFLVRYGAFGTLRALQRGQVMVHLQAWLWTAVHAPRILAERLRGRASAYSLPTT